MAVGSPLNLADTNTQHLTVRVVGVGVVGVVLCGVRMIRQEKECSSVRIVGA
jgi:hypothetical protein